MAKNSFSRDELIALLGAMEEGIVHFCVNCGSFVADKFWKENADFHIYGDCVKET